MRIRGALDLLRQAEGIARAAADAIEGAKRDAVAAINGAISEFFAVTEDLTVTDRMPWYFSPALALVRKVAAAHHQADIRGKAMPLADTDQRAADRLNAAAAPLSEFDLPGGKGGVPGAGPGTDPKITGLPGPLVQDDDQADLNSTLPGSDIEISGDGRSHYPTLADNRHGFVLQPSGSWTF